MKNRIYIFLLLSSLISWGQSHSLIYNLSFIKCDSAVVYYISGKQNKIPKNRTVYYYNDLGNNTKTIEYENYKEYRKSYFTWNKNKIKTEKNHSKVSQYDPDTDKLTGKIYEEHYEKLNHVYENNLLKKSEYYICTAGNIELNNTVIYEYNSLDKLKKETHIDSYVGHLLHYKYNSINIDSITSKKDIKYSYKTYEYKKDFTLINYFKKNELISKEKVFGGLRKPDKVIQLDKKNIIQKEEIYSRDLKGNITNIKVLKDVGITPWGIETFIGNIDNIIISYNQKGNPIEIKYYENGKIDSTEKIEYHAP